MGMLVSMLVLAVAAAPPAAGQAKPAKPAPPPLFTTPLTPEQLSGKQAVIETAAGRIVLELLPEKAPNHVGYFIKLAREAHTTARPSTG